MYYINNIMSDRLRIDPSAPHIPADDEDDFSFQQQLEYAKKESLRELEVKTQKHIPDKEVLQENKNVEEVPEQDISDQVEVEALEEVKTLEAAPEQQSSKIHVEKLPGVPYPRKSVYTQYLEGEVERLHGLMKELCEATDQLQRVDPILYEQVFGHLSFLETPHPGLDGSMDMFSARTPEYPQPWDCDGLTDYAFHAGSEFR